MHGCTSEEVLKNHIKRCELHGAQRIKLPEAGGKKGHDKVKFTKTEYQLRLPFFIYTDFKSVLCKQTRAFDQNSSPSITNITYHVEAGSTWNSIMDNILSHSNWKWVMKSLERFCRQRLANKITKTRLTLQIWMDYNIATNYLICAKPFKPEDKKFHNHDHFKGEYTGPA